MDNQSSLSECETKCKPKCEKVPPFHEKTIVERFYDLGTTNPQALAMVTYTENHTVNKTYTWADYVNKSISFAQFLESLALPKQYPNIAIHAFNSPEWFIAAMGSMCGGRYFCGIYNTNKNEQCTHIIKTGECGVLVIESYKLFSECYSSPGVIQGLKEQGTIIVFIDSTDKTCYPVPGTLEMNTRDWAKCVVSDYTNTECCDKKSVDLKLNLRFKPKLTDICTLIFTSGTTGNPKAVEITYQNVMTAVPGVLDRLNLKMFEERIVTYLPLSHIAGQALDLFCPLYIGTQIHFARPDALKGSLIHTLQAVRPTMFFGVPRVWEKFKEALIQGAEKKYVGKRGKLLQLFMYVVKTVEYQYNTSDNYWYQGALYPLTLASSRIVNKIKEQMGLDKCRYFATGAAPISREVLEYFASIGIPILELYGMSETCGVITVSDPVQSVRGSCGKPIRGLDVKIGPMDEILARGSNVFSAYHNYEGSNGVDAQGYIHTGDSGRVDAQGNLYITGRLKELIITAGGENIPPVLIEGLIASMNSQISSPIVLVGDRKKYLTVLFFNPLDEKALDEKTVGDAIKEYNRRAISNAQKVQKFRIIREKEGLTVENGMMTPTLKLKRSKIHEKYEKIINEMYEGSD